jgi:hypothetical protein
MNIWLSLALISTFLLSFFGITMMVPVIAIETFPIGLDEIVLKFGAASLTKFDRVGHIKPEMIHREDLVMAMPIDRRVNFCGQADQ